MVDSDLIQNTLSEFLAQITELLPTLLLGIVILVLGWVAARVVSTLIKRLVKRFGVDEVIDRTGLVTGLRQAQITQPISELLGMIAFWLVFLSFLMITLETAGLARAITPLQGLVSFLPLLLAAALVLIVGTVLAQFLGRLTQATAASMGIEYHEKLGQAIRWLLLVVTVIVAVEQLGIDLTLITDTLTNLLTIAAASIALAFALGSKDVVRNVLAGFYARELYALGDTLVIDDEEGTLEGISTLNAEVFRGNEKLVIPNSKLIESRVLVRKPTEFEGRKPE